MNAPVSVGWTHGRWSLWDVQNFMMPHYTACMLLVHQEIELATTKMKLDGDRPIDEADKERIRNNLQFPMRKAVEYGFEAVRNRIDRINMATRSWQIMTLSEVVRQMQSLLEAYDDDTQFLYLYAYPKDKMQLYMGRSVQWEAALAKLPAIATDMERALDLYALGHNLGCVFHLMRVMEIGVQRLGRRLGVAPTKLSATKLSDLSWHQILNELNPKLRALPQDTVSRKAKVEQFSAIQSYLYGVKDAWRNPTMHPRKTGYSDLETLNIINHVRSFMNELASALSR
jgi:hypothetical protein